MAKSRSRRDLMSEATKGSEKESSESKDMFDDLRKVNDDKYSSFRMKTNTLQRYKKIAAKRGFAFPGELIHKVLDKWADENE
ncbi:hypothetical protein WJR50_33085 [Catalinimonas sp. 4WD22]|uniref:hypothetical protein n=1 Tax=Catalinimonas locisalis TaxID=3133978 RepID=UPI003100C0A3